MEPSELLHLISDALEAQLRLWDCLALIEGELGRYVDDLDRYIAEAAVCHEWGGLEMPKLVLKQIEEG